MRVNLLGIPAKNRPVFFATPGQWNGTAGTAMAVPVFERGIKKWCCLDFNLLVCYGIASPSSLS